MHIFTNTFIQGNVVSNMDFNSRWLWVSADRIIRDHGIFSALTKIASLIISMFFIAAVPFVKIFGVWLPLTSHKSWNKSFFQCLSGTQPSRLARKAMHQDYANGYITSQQLCKQFMRCCVPLWLDGYPIYPYCSWLIYGYCCYDTLSPIPCDGVLFCQWWKCHV